MQIDLKEKGWKNFAIALQQSIRLEQRIIKNLALIITITGVIQMTTPSKVSIRNVKRPLCDYEDCDKTALYEFTDIVKVDPKSFPTRIKTLGTSCEEHLDDLRRKFDLS